MDTAIQELIDWLISFDGGALVPTRLRIKEEASELLEKEKQQIIDAYKFGIIIGDGQKHNFDEKAKDFYSKDYYNQTFKNNQQ